MPQKIVWNPITRIALCELKANDEPISLQSLVEAALTLCWFGGPTLVPSIEELKELYPQATRTNVYPEYLPKVTSKVPESMTHLAREILAGKFPEVGKHLIKKTNRRRLDMPVILGNLVTFLLLTQAYLPVISKESAQLVKDMFRPLPTEIPKNTTIKTLEVWQNIYPLEQKVEKALEELRNPQTKVETEEASEKNSHQNTSPEIQDLFNPPEIKKSVEEKIELLLLDIRKDEPDLAQAIQLLVKAFQLSKTKS